MNAPPQSTSPFDVRSFTALVSSLEDGELHDQLSKDVRKIVSELRTAALNQGGKPKGKLDLTIEFKVVDSTIEVIATTKVALPKPTRGRSILWMHQDGTLTRQNPKQMDMFGGPREVRDVTTDSASSIRTV